jgi:hypothetical protein
MRAKLLISVVVDAVDPPLMYQALAIGPGPSTPKKWGGAGLLMAGEFLMDPGGLWGASP